MCRIGLVLDHLLVLNTEDCSAMLPKVRMEKNIPPLTLLGRVNLRFIWPFVHGGQPRMHDEVNMCTLHTF